MWNVIHASVSGTSHQAEGRACEDDAQSKIVSSRSGAKAVVIVASDGAGSASRGGDGAKSLVRMLIEKLEANIESLEAESDVTDVIVDIVRLARDELRDEAKKSGVPLRDFACTLIASIAFESRLLSVQIGDGAIVSDTAGSLEVVLWPDAGEYANSTFFITDDDWRDHMRIRILSGDVSRVAVFTDGLQRLALEYSTGMVYQPFFAPMFSALHACQSTDLQRLSNSLAHFLASEKVNALTDDDKTLVLVVFKKASYDVVAL